MLGKILASSLTLSIGGSGGVFAPSLFIGAMAGMAFGTVAHHLFGPAIGPPAMYAVVAMGGVFAAAAQAPLTAIASVIEMTGNFALTLPIMLACGIAAAVSKQLSYGSVYTTKLLRRGIDIERPRPTNVLQTPDRRRRHAARSHLDGETTARSRQTSDAARRRVVSRRRSGSSSPARSPTAAQAAGAVRRRDARPGAAPARPLRPRRPARPLPRQPPPAQGGSPAKDVLRAVSDSVSCIRVRDRARSRRRRLRARATPKPQPTHPSTPLDGYKIIEIAIGPGTPALNRQVDEITWPSRIPRGRRDPRPRDRPPTERHQATSRRTRHPRHTRYRRTARRSRPHQAPSDPADRSLRTAAKRTLKHPPPLRDADIERRTVCRVRRQPAADAAVEPRVTRRYWIALENVGRPSTTV